MKTTLAMMVICALLPACQTGPDLDAHLLHPGDRFNAVVICIRGTAAGGEVVMHDRSGRAASVKVRTTPGQTAEQLAEQFAVALAAAPTLPAARLPFLYRHHTSLLFQNLALGDVYLSATDPGIVTLPPVTDVSVVQTANRAALRWRAEPQATGYVIFRNGEPIGRVSRQTEYSSPLPASGHGQTTWRYEIVAHRDGEIVSPPAAAILTP